MTESGIDTESRLADSKACAQIRVTGIPSIELGMAKVLGHWLLQPMTVTSPVVRLYCEMNCTVLAVACGARVEVNKPETTTLDINWINLFTDTNLVVYLI